MDYTLIKPCPQCPFRTDIKPFITGERAQDICDNLVENQQDFSCHKTSGADNEQMCAGAMIMLEKMERPTQMMRICERLHFYDRNNLEMSSPVYDDCEDMIYRHYEEEEES